MCACVFACGLRVCVRIVVVVVVVVVVFCFFSDRVRDRKKVIQHTIKGKKERIRDIKEKGLLFRMEEKCGKILLLYNTQLKEEKSIY